MKRLTVLSLCLATGVSGYSQTDVSDLFLVNNGFDMAFNYDEKQTGNIAGDVIHEVYGWTNETTATYTVAGTFAYNAGVTFNGSSALPVAGYNGSAGGALGLTTGWGMQLLYTQTVTLPKGTYRLSSAYYNVGSATAGRSLLAWVPESGTETASTLSVFPLRTWKEDEITFTLTAATTGKIRIGFAANEGAGSAAHAKVLVDYVKLLCDEVDKSALRSALSTANRQYGDGTGVYAAELKTVIDAAQAVYDNAEATAREVIMLTQQLTDATQTYQYKNASAAKPLNMTTRIVNPSFEKGTTGWENNGLSTQGNKAFPGTSGATYLERWVNIGSKSAGCEHPADGRGHSQREVPYACRCGQHTAGRFRQYGECGDQADGSHPLCRPL